MPPEKSNGSSGMHACLSRKENIKTIKLSRKITCTWLVGVKDKDKLLLMLEDPASHQRAEELSYLINIEQQFVSDRSSSSCCQVFVMPENSADRTASGENRVGPDFFGLYAREVEDLLSQDEALFPFARPNPEAAGKHCESEGDKSTSKNSSKTTQSNGISQPASLYSNGVGSLLSEFKKERLKSLLRQSVVALTKEVDEMTDPVISVNRIRSLLRRKESPALSNASSCKADRLQHHRKKLKVSTEEDLVLRRETSSHNVWKDCSHCFETSNAESKAVPDGSKSPCEACRRRCANDLINGEAMYYDTEAGMGSGEIDEDLKSILENDSSKVEELMQKHGGELFATLQHMESKLEELLDTVMTTCRPMTCDEKMRLHMAIRNLPPKSLERVAEIIGRNKPSDDDLEVDLDVEDHSTVWRLYLYVAITSS